MKAHPIFSLPPHRLGPYQMKAVPAARSQFEDQRRKIENDWTRGIVRIDESLDAQQTLRYFLRHLIVAIHYRSGLNDKSDEESFTHSLATGLVELARRNEDFWVSLQGIMTQLWSPSEHWDATAAGLAIGNVHSLPASIRYGSCVCPLKWSPPSECELSSAGAYGWYTPASKRANCPTWGPVELSSSLRDANLATVAIHEVIHFLHDCEGLGDKSTEKEFRDGQLRMLPKFIAQNPQFWHWWLDKARRPEPLHLVAAADKPRRRTARAARQLAYA